MRLEASETTKNYAKYRKALKNSQPFKNMLPREERPTIKTYGLRTSKSKRSTSRRLESLNPLPNFARFSVNFTGNDGDNAKGWTPSETFFSHWWAAKRRLQNQSSYAFDRSSSSQCSFSRSRQTAITTFISAPVPFRQLIKGFSLQKSQLSTAINGWTAKIGLGVPKCVDWVVTEASALPVFLPHH